MRDLESIIGANIDANMGAASAYARELGISLSFEDRCALLEWVRRGGSYVDFIDALAADCGTAEDDGEDFGAFLLDVLTRDPKMAH